MLKKLSVMVTGVLISFCVLHAQLAFDTLLFKIPLIDDTTCKSLFRSHGEGRIRKALSGPIIMKSKTLLFYSEYGYILYDRRGAIVDSHSVFQRNRELSKENPQRMTLAFPSNNSTILYYQKLKKGDYPITIFEKKLYKKRLRQLKEKEYKYYLEVGNGHIFNLAHNSITDDMAYTCFALPQLIGFTTLETGNKWWSVDKFYTFSSPIINEKDGKFRSFFPGIRPRNTRDKQQLVTPIKVFKWDKNWYYTGVHANIGTADDKYNQTFYICDPAGNILYSDDLLKMTNRDAIIGEDEDTYYTVKKTERFVFQPTVDSKGNLHYGIIDYVKGNIEVRKRGYYRFKAFKTGPNLAHYIDVEKGITYEPVSMPCNMKQPGGKTIPDVTLVGKKGVRIKAKAKHLAKEEYIARISRVIYRDINKKLARGRSSLPEKVRSIKDSLSGLSTMSCPYTISLSGPKGMIRSFNYPPGEKVLCARVLAVRKNNEVFVRVDCETFAETLIFKTDGEFVNRIVFNKQNYKKRKDVIVATDTSPVIELDYESDKDNGKFFKWKKVVSK